MKNKIIIFISILGFSILKLGAQDYSIEHEYRRVGVFNPEWEMYNILNPRKFQHITGYFREELSRIIINGVREKRVKIYDKRKREISLDTVISKLIDFERKTSGLSLNKDTALDYFIPYVSAYEFEEFTNYNFKTLRIEKKIKAYCPIIIRYKDFNNPDTLEFPMFWIFPNEDRLMDNNDFSIRDTILNLHTIKYPVQHPYSSGIFNKTRERHSSILRANGSKFLSPKEIDKVFIEEIRVSIYNEETNTEEFKTISSDILPEEINNIRIGEFWSINPSNLMIKKQVKFVIPLLETDKGFRELGIRIELE